MSLDVFIACASIAALPAHLPDDIKWQSHSTGSFTTDNAAENWLIEVWVLKPSELKSFALPAGTKSVVGISIQGSAKGDDAAQKALDTVQSRCSGTVL